MINLDVEFVRSKFPAFSAPEFEGKSFFDNAGGSFAAESVINRLNRFYISRKVQPYASYEASTLGGEEMDEARNKLSALLNVSPDNLHFGPSTSQNTYVLARAFDNQKFKRKVIIVTNQDHEANTGSWRKLERSGFIIREWSVNEVTGGLHVDDLIRLLDESVLLVAFPHCSNIIGAINPVKLICNYIKGVGAFACVDGVSYTPHGFLDISDLGADVYMFSTYKTYGTHLGIMYISTELNEVLENQGHYFNKNILSKRFTPAGPDHAQIASSAGIPDYIKSLYDHHFGNGGDFKLMTRLVHDMQRRHETKLLNPLLGYLENRDDLRVLGSTSVKDRVPTVAIDVKDRGKQLAINLSKDGILTDCGDFYAVRLLKALGVDINYGVLRISFVHYTSEQDINNLISSLDRHL